MINNHTMASCGNSSEDSFYALVKKMRLAQREYFACRCQSRLNRAKKLERQVDEMVQEYENSKLPKQAQLRVSGHRKNT